MHNNETIMLSETARHMPPEVSQTSAASSENGNRYQIRSMIESDLNVVIEIEQQTWGSHSWNLDNFLEAFNGPSYCCWILEDITRNHLVTGYGFQYAASGGESHITNLTLRASERGRGVGGVLLRHMISHARRIYARGITLEVDTSNERAYKLYANHGFRIVRRLLGYYSKYEDAYDMRLVLRPSLGEKHDL